MKGVAVRNRLLGCVINVQRASTAPIGNEYDQVNGDDQSGNHNDFCEPI